MNFLKIRLLLILLISSPFWVTSLFGQLSEQPIRFSTLGPENNLSQSSVSHIIQDDQGVMWVATQVGIDRYDGRDFEPIPNLSKALVESFTILKDSKDGIWVGIDKRLFLINKKDYKADTKNEAKLDTTLVKSNLVNVFPIEEDPQFSYLLFTENNIFKHRRKVKKLSELSDIPVGIKISKVVSIGKNRFAIGTASGLYHLEWQNDQNVKMEPLKLNVNITALHYNEKDGYIYAGTDTADLLIFKVDNNSFAEISNDLKTELSVIKEVKPSVISSIYVDTYVEADKNEVLWIGTQNAGLYLFEINKKSNKEIDLEDRIECHAYCPDHQEINSNKVTCITASSDGVVWVGTEVGGINYWKKYEQHFNHLFKREFIGKNKTGNSDSLRTHDNYALGLLSVDSDRLLVGSNEGLVILDTENQNSFKKIAPDSEGVKAQIISTIVRPDNSKADIILGTGDGLYQISLDNLESPSTYTKIKSAAGDTSISILYYHKSSEEWWVSNRAKYSITVLNKDFTLKKRLFFPEDEKISFFQELKMDGISGILVATVKSMYWYRDTETKGKKFKTHSMHVLCATSIQGMDELWLGTDRKGLYKYDTDNEVYTDSITIKDNFEEEVVYGVLPDKFKNLWISTNHGLFQICPKNRLVNRYAENDLGQVGEFNSGSFCTTQDSSTFYFGGIDGVSTFKPKDIVESSIVTKPNLMVSFSYPELGKESLVYPKISKNMVIEIPRIPNHFNYLDIDFTLPNYHDALNNQFRVVLDHDTLFATDGVLNLTESQFTRKIINCNILKVDYRSGNGEWVEGGTFKINRGFWTRELSLLALVASLLYLISFIIRRYNANNLIRIQSRINEVSRSETIEALKYTVKKHLINDFDYVIISLVNFNQKRIVSVDSACKNNSITNPKDWIINSNYSLDEKDILAQIVNKKISAVVFKNEILNSEIEEEGALNVGLSKEYKHDRLARLYVPIIHKTKKHPHLVGVGPEKKNEKSLSEEDKDFVLGVIEVGFIPKAYERFYPIIRKFIQWAFPENGYIARFLSPLEYLRHKEVQLKIYADNFAQPYYRAVLKENRQNFYEEVLDPYEEKETKHFEFIHLVLENSAKKIGAEYGNIAFRSFNNDGIHMTDRRNVFYGENYDQDTIKSVVPKFKSFNEGKKGLINHVVETKTPYYCNDILKDEFYIRLKEDIRSEAAFPMMDKYKVIYGVFILSSTKENFFNGVLVETIKKVVDKATESFLKKVESNTLTQLMTPFDIFSRSNDLIYKNAVETLKQYFYADYIGVWKRFREDKNIDRDYSIEKDKNKFILSDVTTKELWKLFKQEKYQLANLSDDVIKENKSQPIQIIEVAKYKNRNARIVKVCEALEFKSYVVLSIVIDGRIEAFFNIFSKRKIDQEELSQYSLEFLENFSNKIHMALQHAELISAFTDISQSLSNQEVENTLNLIVEEAYDLLPSTNSVVLFPYRGKEITLEEVYAAGDIPEADKKDKKKPANFANYVLENGTQWINSEEENNKIVLASKETGPDRLTFWEKNNIKSSAAVLLKYGTRPIGVMFFNYNEKKDFEKRNAKRIIQAFTNLATTALINEGFIASIKEESSILARQNQLQKDLRENIEKENRELGDKMDIMLPKAATASNFLILQGVNHDVRNFMLRIQVDLMDLDIHATGKNKEIIKESLEDIHLNIKNIHNLLLLFDFRNERGKEKISINTTIQQVITFFKNKDKFVDFRVKAQKEIPDLLCLKAEFSMIIYNLINNAVQAMNNKGTITIKTKFIENKYIIKIKDDGEGIDNDDLKEIFEFGYTTKGEGSGIGLYFVEKTVTEKLEGKIMVNSFKNKGTEFTLEIPDYINYKN